MLINSKKADNAVRLSKNEILIIKEKLHNMRMINLLKEHIEHLKNLEEKKGDFL